jgi:hypothetical protein
LGEGWRLLATAKGEAFEAPILPEAPIAPPEHDQVVFYKALHDAGLGYGPAFQGVIGAQRDGDHAVGLVRLPETAGSARGLLAHPALLDACLQTLTLLRDPDAPLRVPTGVARARFGTSPVEGELVVKAQRRVSPSGEAVADLWVWSRAGVWVAALEGVALRPVAGARDALDGVMLSVVWEELAAPPPPSGTPGRFVLVAGGSVSSSLGARLGANLSAAGAAVTLLTGLHPEDPDALGQMLTPHLNGARAVVNLFALDAVEPEDLAEEQVHTVGRAGWAGAGRFTGAGVGPAEAGPLGVPARTAAAALVPVGT